VEPDNEYGIGKARSTEERQIFIATKKKFLAEFLTFEQAIDSLAFYISYAEDVKISFANLKALARKQEKNQILTIDDLCIWSELIADFADFQSAKVVSLMNQSSDRGKAAAEVRHGKPGGSRDKRQAMLDSWASGKYSSRNTCAEEECAGIGLSFSKARKHLIGTADNSKSL
jgi:hypothetical protein